MVNNFIYLVNSNFKKRVNNLHLIYYQCLSPQERNEGIEKERQIVVKEGKGDRQTDTLRERERRE